MVAELSEFMLYCISLCFYLLYQVVSVRKFHSFHQLFGEILKKKRWFFRFWPSWSDLRLVQPHFWKFFEKMTFFYLVKTKWVQKNTSPNLLSFLVPTAHPYNLSENQYASHRDGGRDYLPTTVPVWGRTKKWASGCRIKKIF